MPCRLRRMAESVRSISEDAIGRPVRIRDAILTAGSNSMLETSDLPMFEEFQQTARTIFESAQKRGALTRNPDAARLRQKALDRQRAEFMDRFPGLHPKIKGVFQA